MPSAPLSTLALPTSKSYIDIYKAKPVNNVHDDKENMKDQISNYVAEVGSQNLEDGDLPKSSPQLPLLPSQKPCPRTPTNRIPLADLIGNTEDAFNCGPKDRTPEDQIYWQHGPTPQSPPPSAPTYDAPNGSKRARSSSPDPWSQNQTSAHFDPQGAIYNKTLHESLKTPHNDPALDLWARYTDATVTRMDTGGVHLPAFAHLMNSSPQAPGTTNGKDGGLRRSISCGIEWPASKAKRRKLNEVTEGRTKDVFAATKPDIMAPSKSKASRIALLMEKLQENSRRVPQMEISGPSSSSPLPDRNGLPNLSMVSPLSKRKEFQQEAELVMNGDLHQSKQDFSPNQNECRDNPSSEFGDEDLALEALEAVEQASCIQAASSADGKQGGRSPPSTNGGTEPIYHECRGHDGSLQTVYKHADAVMQEVSQSHGEANCGSLPAVLPGASGTEDDEDFGGEADDIGVMADLAAQFDTQQTTSTPHPLEEQGLVPGAGAYKGGTALPQAVNDDDGYDNDYDDDLWDHIQDNAVTSQQDNGVAGASKSCRSSRAIKRYLILNVAESRYLNFKGRHQLEKMLSVKDEKTGMLKIILLRQAWLDSRCTKGSYVHLIGEFDQLGQCIVDDQQNMIILHPDHLISATVVADSFTCTRRAVLQDRIKATGAAEPSQVYGHILHEVFGEALKANDWNVDSLKKIIERILSNWIEPLYEINTQVPQAVDYLLSKMPELQAWASIFVNAQPAPRGEVRDRNGCISFMSVNKLLEVEERIWSPMYGLKGNVDATIQVTLQEPNKPGRQTLTVPLEFKTGKRDNNEMHRAQTALYTLLLSDRYDINVTCGVLYYLETSKTFRVQAVRNEIRHMIIQRNELACYVRNKLELPPLVKKPFLCNNCYAQTSCFTYHKLVDGGDGESSGLGKKFEEATSHLKPVHQTFFRKWDELLTKEERDAMKFRRELWTMLSDERESLGRCFGDVYIEPRSAIETRDGPKINRYQYTFLKHEPKAEFSFVESQLTVGEPIVVSDNIGHYALATGYITKVRPSRLTIAVDRKLHHVRRRCRGFDPETNQVFNGIMEASCDRDSATPSLPASEPGGVTLFRIDKDEFSNGMATVRNNLIRMMEKDLFKARELRKLIVEREPPSFAPSASAYTLARSSSQPSLNIDQVQAIEKVMSAKDYALVLGMPGTGKTTTIAHIIRALVSRGKSVLLTSYTHTAVDNILLKIKDDGIRILRLGAVAKVHPDVQAFADLAGIPKRSMAELEESYVNSKVVASTCLGVNHPIFNARIFDYCIVDEASQITLPTCLGPIRMAKTFILVGDHYQLPPLVQNQEAQKGGLDISLFKMLSDSQPDSVVNLEHQYRMAEDIMLLSNTLIYNGRLKCGTEAVARCTLSIPDLESGLAVHHQQPGSLYPSSATSVCVQQMSHCWLSRAVTPSSRCLFLNTDPLGPSSRDTVTGPRITNPVEARLTTQLVQTLLSSGVPARSIGVITFYRSQLALLRQTLGKMSDVEMHTADKFQGRDKEVVILSCVRSNEAGSIGELLKDWRRVNVAITRARSKLLILGSRATLDGCGNETWEGLVGLMAAQGWILDLPSNAAVDGFHAFFDGGPPLLSLSASTPMLNPIPTQKSKTRSPKKRIGVNRDEKMFPSPTKNRNAMSSTSPTKSATAGAAAAVASSSSSSPSSPSFKTPSKVFNGIWGQAQRAYAKSGIMQDIVNGI